MSERETTSVETPVKKHKVVIYTYLTGREFEYCQEPLYQALAAKASGGPQGVQFGNLDMTKVREATQRLIEKQVVSVDGETENVTDKCLDMHSVDYQFVVEQLQNLSKKN